MIIFGDPSPERPSNIIDHVVNILTSQITNNDITTREWPMLPYRQTYATHGVGDPMTPAVGDNYSGGGMVGWWVPSNYSDDGFFLPNAQQGAGDGQRSGVLV